MKFTKKDATAFFAQLFGGEHNIPSKVKKYAEGYGVHTAQTLATFDSDLLTRLVTQANDSGVRAAIYPHSSTRQLIVIKRIKNKRFSTAKQAVETFKADTATSLKTQVDQVRLNDHANAKEIIDALPDQLGQQVRDAMRKGLPVILSNIQALPLSPSLLQSILGNSINGMKYAHMCEVHPEFAQAFKSYLNGMGLDEAVNAAERDLSPPACLEAFLREIGEHYFSLPEDGRT